MLEFIASRIQTNIRELEGALIRVSAFASLNRQPVDLTLAEIVLKDLIPEGGEPEITSAAIIAQTAAYSGLSIEELCGQSRSRALVTARQIAMYLCRELTDCRCPRSASSSAATTPPSCMPNARSVSRWPSAAASTTKSPSSPTGSSSRRASSDGRRRTGRRQRLKTGPLGPQTRSARPPHERTRRADARATAPHSLGTSLWICPTISVPVLCRAVEEPRSNPADPR